MQNTVAIGGMSLPLVLTAAFSDADASLREVADEVMEEGRSQIKAFRLDGEEDDDI